jgi:hypothetical protein
MFSGAKPFYLEVGRKGVAAVSALEKKPSVSLGPSKPRKPSIT